MFSKIFQILESLQNVWNVSRNVLPLCNPNSVWFLMWSECFFFKHCQSVTCCCLEVTRVFGLVARLLCRFYFSVFFLACPVSRVFWTVDCVIFFCGC